MAAALPDRSPLSSIPLADWQRDGASLDYQGHRIFYRASEPAGEERPTLLLIHGYPTASWDWARLWRPLAAGFRLVAPDLLGFGFSAKPRDFPYSVMRQADVIERVLAQLSVTACHVLAHDYGDTVAQELLARQRDGTLPFRLHSMCFLNGGLFPESHRPLLIQRLMLGPLGGLVARLASRRRFFATMAGLFVTPPTDEELDGFWRLVNADDGRPVLAKHIRYMVERKAHRPRWVGALIDAGIPLCLIDGAADPISGAHLARRYQQLVPDPDVVLLDGVGHYPQVEAPAAVLAAFQAFQARAAARAGS